MNRVTGDSRLIMWYAKTLHQMEEPVTLQGVKDLMRADRLIPSGEVLRDTIREFKKSAT